MPTRLKIAAAIRAVAAFKRLERVREIREIRQEIGESLRDSHQDDTPYCEVVHRAIRAEYRAELIAAAAIREAAGYRGQTCGLVLPDGRMAVVLPDDENGRPAEAHGAFVQVVDRFALAPTIAN